MVRLGRAGPPVAGVDQLGVRVAGRRSGRAGVPGGPGGSRCWLDQQWLDRQAQALDEGPAGVHRDSVDGRNSGYETASNGRSLPRQVAANS